MIESAQQGASGTPGEPASRGWDVIVVGTGMGGATLGYALARAGWRVLFCERGKANLPPMEGLRGKFAEEYYQERRPSDRNEALRASGRWASEILDLSGGKSQRFVPFLGSGGGGSSALYGTALERFTAEDFTPGRHHPNAVGSRVPKSWPISYSDLVPHYETAERLYAVRGSVDSPLPPSVTAHAQAPASSAVARELSDFFVQKGLHPYRLPLACEFVPGCRGCQGKLCDRNCKNDSAKACLAPALRSGATLVDECTVLRLETDGRAVTAVICLRRGQEMRLSAKIVVLAAGALHSPAILLRSACSHFPRGLANGSGLVGTCLMRHYVDLYAVFTKSQSHAENQKELALSDFYVGPSGKFGSVQSFGEMPPAAVLVEDLRREVSTNIGQWAAFAVARAKPVLHIMLANIFARAHVLASILEDLPYPENRVEIADDGTLSIRYRIREYEAERIAAFRTQVGAALRPYRYLLLKQAANNQRLAHVCGTCRFGSDPRESVLNATNKAHELTNLYVVDASFFPSSGGTNPALTVAANALRVASHLLQSYK